MSFTAPHGAAILDYLGASGAAQVLDIAGGTGEPGLSIAKHLGAGGRVVITDLSEGMLAVAREKVKGASYVEFEIADANDLPFPASTFDAVSCRHGFMFFPDMQRTAREMARVLKPGGKAAIAVWAGPEKNFWITCMMENITKHIPVPSTAPGAPGMFRCAQPGLLVGIFRDAGFRVAEERMVPCILPVSGPEEYWNMMTEIAAPFVAALKDAPTATVAKVKADVLAAMGERYPNGHIECMGIVITAVK